MLSTGIDPESSPLTTAYDVERIRQDFPILTNPQPNGKRLVYLDNGATTQSPQIVIDRLREVQEAFYANAYRGVYRIGSQIDDELEASREAVRRLIGARETAEIAFTSGTTMSCNIVAMGWGRRFLKPGDEILISLMEHHANFVPWQQIASETGATLQIVPLTDDFRFDVEQVRKLMTDRTRMLALTGMSNVLGTLPDLQRIIPAAKGVGATVFIDAAQLIAQTGIDVQALDIDLLAFSGHKLHGPSGVGVLYGKRDVLEEMQPLLFGGHMIAEVHPDRSTWAELPAKFEAGTIPIVPAIGLRPAIEYVEAIGLDAIHTHKQQLLVEATERLSEVPGLKIYGPPLTEKGAVISFTIDGVHPQDLATLLDRFNICVRHGHHCTMPLHSAIGVPATTRVSLGLYNGSDDIDVLMEGIAFARKRLRVE